jgi:pre-mRNA cleavage complex 2 protein Pcf11
MYVSNLYYVLLTFRANVSQDWLLDSSTARKGKGRADGPNGRIAIVEDREKRLAELRAQFVVVPAGDEAKQIACPVCKELLKAEFNEDEEEWIWRNATRVDERVCNYYVV